MIWRRNIPESEECVLTQYAADLRSFLLQHYLFNTHTAVVFLITYNEKQNKQTSDKAKNQSQFCTSLLPSSKPSSA